MSIEEFAILKEEMMIAKEKGDFLRFKKYYELVAKAYEELTGENFEENMRKMEKDFNIK